MVVVTNTFGTDESFIVAIFQQLFPLLAPELENAIEAFPIPSLLGLDLSPVEVARLPGGFIGLFADLVQTPTSTLQNVTFDDLSTGDFRRGRAAAGCANGATGSPARRSATASPPICAACSAPTPAAPPTTRSPTPPSPTASPSTSSPCRASSGRSTCSTRSAGALDRISDGYNDGIGFQDGGGSASLLTNMEATYRLDGGPPVSFGFAASPTSINDGVGGSSSNQDVEFSGSGGAVVQGTTQRARGSRLLARAGNVLELEYPAIPTANGDEMAIRLGKNDTIDNNFTGGPVPRDGQPQHRRRWAQGQHHASPPARFPDVSAPRAFGRSSHGPLAARARRAANAGGVACSHVCAGSPSGPPWSRCVARAAAAEIYRWTDQMARISPRT